MMIHSLKSSSKVLFITIASFIPLLLPFDIAFGQGQTKWVAVGSMHNWYSEMGAEIEHGNVRVQQYGLRWPAQYKYQDMQAAKGFWIGTTNFTDAQGITYPHKVVHVGPRVNGDNEFFPVKFELYARFEPPRVFVDGTPTFSNPEDIKAIDPTLKADRMLLTVVNTAIGITMTRRVYQFSQQYHDNYHILDFTFTNTGNTDGDPEIELPNKTLTGVYFYWQFRYAINREIRYAVNNSAGWGINTMNDARGPWYPSAPNDLRCQFAWHGLHPHANKPPLGSSPNAATYDNIGAPIWNPHQSARFIDPADTTWRLGAPQFVGNVTLHVDRSPTDKRDDPNQPSTTNYIGSDDPLTRENSQFNIAKMTAEYMKMSEGHQPRHAWLVEPAGNFSEPRNDPALGTPGGWSSGNGYGPFTLGPGQSIRIVFAEGASGLSREAAIRIGKMYKDGLITTKAKNDSVLTGRDSLFQTFRRAIANFNSGYNIPQPPYPPSEFHVRSGGDRIELSWRPNANESANGFQGYRIYRAKARPDSTFRLIFQCGGPPPTEPGVVYVPQKVYRFSDTSVIRGVAYYYYITAFGSAAANTGVGNTPPGPLESSRFYTQTYDPAYLKRAAGKELEEIRVVPNPFNISADPNLLRYPYEPDKIGFLNIPGECTIKIYTESGELIYTIEHNDGSGDAYWNSVTSSGQVVVSGVYIAVIETPDGRRAIRKFVIIR